MGMDHPKVSREINPNGWNCRQYMQGRCMVKVGLGLSTGDGVCLS